MAEDIYARSLILVDDDGKVRGSLSVGDDGGIFLSFGDRVMGVFDDDAVLFDFTVGESKATIMLDRLTASVTVKSGTATKDLFVSKDQDPGPSENDKIQIFFSHIFAIKNILQNKGLATEDEFDAEVARAMREVDEASTRIRRDAGAELILEEFDEVRRLTDAGQKEEARLRLQRVLEILRSHLGTEHEDSE
jgi:hypothetical protein